MLSMHSPPGAETVVEGRRYLYFAGTAYLGLQGHAEVIEAACRATAQYGLGSATTRAWFGTMPPVLDVERAAARFFGCQAAFYYASGYLGPMIVAEALADCFDAVFLDRQSHYCLHSGLRVAGRPVYTFAARDAAELAALLRKRLPPGGRPLVASDGVFSVRGAIAPVDEYLRVLAGYPGSALLLDDAHGVGVLGPQGRGTYEHFGRSAEEVNAGLPGLAGGQELLRGFAASPPHPQPLSREGRGEYLLDGRSHGDGPALLMIATLSKALGGFGGIMAGSTEFIDAIKTRSPAFAGASAPAVPAAAASARALELVLAGPELRGRLAENVRLAKAGLRALGLTVDDTPVPIICLTIGEVGNMRRIQQTLMDRGILVAYAAAYSGVGAEGALRLAVSALHTPEMIEELAEVLAEVI